MYLGRTNVDVCPVAAVLAYMVIRGPAPGPFFRFEDGKYLTRGCFVAAVRAALKQSSIDDSKYSCHSFRIGAATTAARAHQGLSDSLIITLGCWESSAYTIYIRTQREALCNVSGLLVKGTNS